VAGANAYRRKEKPSLRGALRTPREYYYTWAAIAMLAGAAVLVALWLAGVVSLFWVEILVTVLFIIFWAIQTIELEARAGGVRPLAVGTRQTSATGRS
jgi:hypothetical protein